MSTNSSIYKNSSTRSSPLFLYQMSNVLSVQEPNLLCSCSLLPEAELPQRMFGRVVMGGGGGHWSALDSPAWILGYMCGYCLALCQDLMFGVYWFRLSLLSMVVIGSFASYTKTKSVESAVWCLLTLAMMLNTGVSSHTGWTGSKYLNRVQVQNCSYLFLWTTIKT